LVGVERIVRGTRLQWTIAWEGAYAAQPYI